MMAQLLGRTRLAAGSDRDSWVRYPWRVEHPLLQYLPSKLADYLGENLAEPLNIPDKAGVAWTVEEQNQIILNCVVAQRDGKHLEPWRELQWECDAFRGVSTARCCPTKAFGFRGAVRKDCLMTLRPKPYDDQTRRFRMCSLRDFDDVWVVRPQLFFDVHLAPWGKTGPEYSDEHYSASLVFFSTFEPTNLTPGWCAPRMSCTQTAHCTLHISTSISMSISVILTDIDVDIGKNYLYRCRYRWLSPTLTLCVCVGGASRPHPAEERSTAVL